MSRRRWKLSSRGVARACLLAGLAAGCAPKNPEAALVRQMKKHDRAAAKRVPTAHQDDSFFVPAGDALASAAESFGKGTSVAEATDTSVAADWSYDGDVKLDEHGEFFIQRRRSPVMTIASKGVEVTVSGSTIRERRRLRPGKEPGDWKQTTDELDVAGARRALADLEERHLATVQADGPVDAALTDFEAELTAGFEVTERTAHGLTAQRIDTQRNEVKGGAWATWEARVTLAVAVEQETGAITVTGATDHRITTSELEGVWESASAADQALTIDWLARALRRGMPEGRSRYGPALLPAVADAVVGYSEPPPPPPLRTMDDIERIITERAWTTSTGKFTVCLDRVVVNSTSSSGQAWDVPNFSGSTNPDITGSVTIANRQFPITQADDLLSVQPKACATGNYRAGAPYTQVRIEDVDLTSNDTIRGGGRVRRRAAGSVYHLHIVTGATSGCRPMRNPVGMMYGPFVASTTRRTASGEGCPAAGCHERPGARAEVCRSHHVSRRERGVQVGRQQPVAHALLRHGEG